MTFQKVIFAAAVALAFGSVQAETLQERIAPVGKVRLAGQPEPAAPAAPAAAEAAAPAEAAAAPAEVAAAPAAAAVARDGKSVYDTTCFVCHAAGVAGAPKLGDKAAWAPRIAQGEEALMHTVLNGKNAMPPRGTCGNCSDEELKAAMEYMVSAAQ